MSTKAKLKLRHIEDADKSKAVNVAPEPATPKLVASKPLVTDDKKIKALNAAPELTSEGESGSAVGALLQRARMEKDLSLQDVAEQLRIQRSYLQALETGDFDSLPGLTYAIGYVRSYSQLVDLDAEKLITDFKAEAKKLQEPTQLSFPSPAPEGKVPGGALMFIGVLLAAVSYGGWYYFSTSETTVSDLTPTVPDRLAFLLEEPAIESPEPATAAAPDTRTARAPVTAPAADEAATDAKTVEAPATEQQTTAAPDTAPAEPSATDTAGTETPAGTAAATDPVQTATSATPGPAATDGTAQIAATAPAAPESAAPGSTGPGSTGPGSTGPGSTGPESVETESARAESVPAAPAAAPATETASAEDTAAPAEQVMAAPAEPASAPVVASATVAGDIPAVPEVARETSQSAVDAEAAAIDSKPAPAPAASQEGPRIVISATDDSWVQVRGKDATPLLTRILRKGERYEVPARSGLRLFTGNAGALKISVNGSEAPSLGPFGKIARNIPLDESLLTYSATD